MHTIVIWMMVFYEYTIAVIRLIMLLIMLIVMIPCMCALCCRGQSISYYVGVRLFRDYASEDETQILPQKEEILQKVLRKNRTRFQAGECEGECAICLGPFRDWLVFLDCNREHQFHEVCITEWARKKLSCPLCRAEIRDPDECPLRPPIEDDEEIPTAAIAPEPSVAPARRPFRMDTSDSERARQDRALLSTFRYQEFNLTEEEERMNRAGPRRVQVERSDSAQEERKSFLLEE